MHATCIYPKYWNFYEFQNLTVQLTGRKNPIKNFNSFDSRWIVETTVKIFVLKFMVGKKIFGVVKDGWHRFSGISPLDSCNTLKFYLCCYIDSAWEFPPPGTSSFDTYWSITCQSSPKISKTLGFGCSSAIVSGPLSSLSEFVIHSVQRCVLVDYWKVKLIFPL